ncbi:MAG TPA: cobalt-precorrin-6A reductase [Pseudonocardiaceae bacterium]|nr:cobalt-precorrin-6A reductase [Pseudonocardiaceae bacterium]
MTVRVLLLGGTGDARHLAQRLAEEGIDVTTALAGRVRTPLLPPGTVRVGGFGGPDGLTDWLRETRIDAVVDATHPFATTITANALTATARLGLPLLALRRPDWQPRPGDRWHRVDTLADAATRLPELGRRVFLTTGRRTDLTVFADPDLWILLRAVDPPDQPTPPNVTVVIARGPFTVDGETALLREHRIDVLVTRDSGGEHTASKLVAARELGLPVLLIRRPAPPDTPNARTKEEVMSWLHQLNAGGNAPVASTDADGG